MPSPEFLAGLLVLTLTVAAALLLGRLAGIDPTWTLLGLGGLVWAVAAVAERRLTRRLDQPEVQAIHVDWSDRINDTDFSAEGAETRAELARHGLTPETAQGQTFVFATEHDGSDGDIWFEGTLLRLDGRIVIRATEPL